MRKDNRTRLEADVEIHHKQYVVDKAKKLAEKIKLTHGINAKPNISAIVRQIIDKAMKKEKV